MPFKNTKHFGYLSLRAKVNYMYSFFKEETNFLDKVETAFQIEFLKRIKQLGNAGRIRAKEISSITIPKVAN